MTSFLSDLRHACRQLRRSPGFAATAILVLGVGIGANAAVLSVAHGVLHRPLPFPEPDEVVAVWSRFGPPSGLDFPEFWISGPEFLDYRQQARTVASLAAFRPGATNLASPGAPPDRVPLVAASSAFLDVLRVPPVLGRGFVREDERPGAPCVVLLSHGLWWDRFSGDPGTVGRLLRLDDRPCRVVGVMPEGFTFPDARFRLWRNLALGPEDLAWGRMSHNLQAVGRLAPDVPMEAARAEMDALMTAWAEEMDHYRGHELFLRPLRDDVLGEAGPRLTVLLAAVGAVLLLACANVAGLFLARGEGRRRELQVRVSLGAGRPRLFRQLLTEGGVLAVLGGVIGTLGAAWVVGALPVIFPGGLPPVGTVAPDFRLLALAGTLVGMTVLLFALVPALRLSDAGSVRGLAGGRQAVSRSRASLRTRRLLVAGQITLGTIVVAVATLLARSYAGLAEVDPGFRPDEAVALTVALSEVTYGDPDRVRVFYDRLLQEARGLPGVRAAGAISSLPLRDGAGPADGFIVEGRRTEGDQLPNAGFVMVTPGAIEALGIPLLEGRRLLPSDDEGAPLVAVVNRTAAVRYWDPEGPVGRRVRYPSPDPEEAPRWIQVVGIVGDTRADGLRQAARPVVLVPHAQLPRAPFYDGRAMTLVVRTEGAPTALAPTLREIVGRLDPGLPLADLRPLDDVLARSLDDARLSGAMTAAFAAVSLTLAALGLFALLGQHVTERRREIGLRLALGARPSHVVREVVGGGLRLTLPAVALGVVASAGAGRLLEGLLFRVDPLDPVLYLAVTAAVGGTALLASWIPARRAASVEPAVTLRAE
jgi:putative ABC transport system permease protein